MSLDATFPCDSEFVKLLGRRSDVDLTLIALELTRDAYPHLEFRPTLDWIAQRADELAGPVAGAVCERKALGELGRCLAFDHGICGDLAAYERADSSFLPKVIETRRGIPISLSLLYMAVGGQLGLDLQGVSAPMHFLTRYESAEGPLFVDAFGSGRILTQDECARWIASIAKLTVDEAYGTLEPAHPRTVVLRMLNNLKALYARQENWAQAWVVQHRLTVLQPSVYRERRDLAIISVRANRPGCAIDLLESCLSTCPRDEEELLEHHLDEARSQLCRWN